jgi:alpha-beta hydrolase superfamily lysophospholipase
MTNLYNSSKRPKLLIIHGLNNNLKAFEHLRDEFQTLGHDCHFITLPGHDKDRDEARTFQSAFKVFDTQMKVYCHEPYAVIAFSQGALYLQLWIAANKQFAPLAQVLLAPALYINHQKIITRLLSVLPSFAFVPSLTPLKLRRYHKLHIWEYRTLFEAVKRFQEIKEMAQVPTLILIDPEDELINVEKLKQSIYALNEKHIEFDFVIRKTTKALSSGKHHILFHPQYFNEEQWKSSISKLAHFLRANGFDP